MHPKQLSINDFTYDLPADKIAKYPLEQRDKSSLLVYKNGELAETQYQYLDEQLPAGAMLVFNNTKVVEARLLFEKASGGVIELFCLEPGEQYPDITTAMVQKNRVVWKCLVGGAKKWKEELITKQVITGNKIITLTATKIAHLNDHFLIGLVWNDPEASYG